MPVAVTSTPTDYHRIVSSTLKVPTDIVPVGLLACQRDPLRREIQTVIISSRVSQPPADKRPKKGALTSGGPLLEVVLHDTVIFPEGGGQPSDTGIIQTVVDGLLFSVVQVRRIGLTACHYVSVGSADVESALVALAPGQKVRASLDDAGFDRRMDHASMHTSQHLLSAILETDLNLPTLSWSLTEFPSPCYVEIPRGMTLEEIDMVQKKANRLVLEGRKVHVEVSELDEQEREPVPKLESGRSVGKALPEDYTGGVKRVVIIEGVDKNPCCGTHLPSLHNLQLFLIPHTEALSRSHTTSARLYFYCGPRLILHLSSTHSLLKSTAALMNCGLPNVPDRVDQVIGERKQSEKRVEEVECELARYIAGDIFAKVKAQGGFFREHVHRTDSSANPLGFLSAIGYAFNDLANAPYLLVLSSSPLLQTAASLTVVCVFGSDAKQVKALGDILKSKLGIKGGGQGIKWSGKVTGVWGNKQDGIVNEALESDGV